MHVRDTKQGTWEREREREKEGRRERRGGGERGRSDVCP